MKKAIMLLPIAVMVLSITYSGFSSTVGVGKVDKPNIVQTGTMDWRLYLPSELEWINAPDIADFAFYGSYSYTISISNNVSITPLEPPESIDVGNASISKNGDTVSITLKNVYPGYGAVAHFVYVNEGSIPSKLSDVNLTINDPYNIAKDVRAAIIIVWSPTGDLNNPVHVASIVGCNLTDIPRFIKKELSNVVFQPGGWVAFCKPNNATIKITDVEINPNSGLPQYLIDYLNNTDSFWIVIKPDSKPPQGAYLSFNLTLTFGQFNE